MALKRIGIALPLLGISGGINIVLNWGVILARAGYRIDLILPPPEDRGTIPFLDERDRRHFRIVPLPEARRQRYHTVIATWWECLPMLADLDAEHYAWFMQAVEGQFFESHSESQRKFDMLVASRMNVIVTAHWLRRHIERHANLEPKQTFCVLSGLDKSLWRPMVREPLCPARRPVRFLVEGPAIDARKNVARTVRLLERLGVPYSWVGASVDPSIVGEHCRRVEAQVPYRKMPAVYADSDVLVKASNAEGMFGPPLEMFATGGTAVCWDVQGAEEYMADRSNCRLVPMNSWTKLAEAVLELADDPDRVLALQAQAMATAEAWPTWDDQADQIVATIESLAPFDRSSLIRQVARATFQGAGAKLEESRLKAAWLESEIAARDAKLGELWAEAEARGRTIDALRLELGSSPIRRASRLIGRLARRWIGRQAVASYRSRLRRAFRSDPPVPAPAPTDQAPTVVLPLAEESSRKAA